LSSGVDAEVEAPAPEVDPLRQRLLDELTEALGDGILGSGMAAGELTVRVAHDRWRDAIKACRARLHMQYFCFLGGMDWLENPGLAGEKTWGSLPEEGEGSDDSADAEPVESPGRTTGVAGGDTRFQLFCRLYSIRDKVGITLKVDLDETNPSLASIADLYRGADWHEREAWEMYGFDFPGHPGLRHMYLPSEFEGFPGRKDFPLLAREVKPWPGLVDVEPLPGGDAEAEAEAEGETATAEGGEG
jgi:NADH-quinone oxidoreductase subunit C